MRLLDHDARHHHGDEDHASEEDDGAEMHILQVEPNLVNQRVALGILHKLGFTADPVSEGFKIIEALSETT